MSTLDRFATNDFALDMNTLHEDYIPEHIPMREKQIEAVTEELGQALSGTYPSHMMIYGHSGTGKTVVIRYLLNELETAVRNCGKSSDVIITYINCRENKTETRILGTIAQTVGETLPYAGLSIAEYYKRARQAVDKEGRIVIIILDEIEKLATENILYTFTRPVAFEKAHATVVGITNRMTFYDDLPPNIQSSFGRLKVFFPPYNAIQLQEILRYRLNLALKEGKNFDDVMEGDALPLVAALSAQEHGDARLALELLREAVKLSRKEGGKITEDVVRRAHEQVEVEAITQAVRMVPTQQKTVLAAIVWLDKRFKTRSEFPTVEVYAQYKKMAKGLELNVLTQRRISGLLRELTDSGILQSKVISRGIRGRTAEFQLLMPRTILHETLLEDSQFEDLIGGLR